ncbi:hypothetical protein [Microbulbifer variabilis]|uniref:hypothetical protein n=1 Tax=Microbulbifer variabilis TaxID=266805 RepID=UPI00037E27E4|nr:hypothetical protein [Microbulbifer variabilis]
MKGLEFIDQPINAENTGEVKNNFISTLVRKADVVLQGKTLGDITVYRYPNGKLDIHACFYIGNIQGPTTGLIQGHGRNYEEAINNAFNQSRKEAENFLKSLEQLAKRIQEGTTP